MVIPCGSGWNQELMLVDRTGDGEGEYTTKNLMGVRYVPLVK